MKKISALFYVSEMTNDFFFLICLEIKVRNQSWIFLFCMNSGKLRSWQWDISLYGISKLIHEEKRVELGYYVWVLSHFSHSTLCDPMDCSPLSMGLPRQEYGSGCHFFLQGSFWLRDWAHVSRTADRFFTTSLTWQAQLEYYHFATLRKY